MTMKVVQDKISFQAAIVQIGMRSRWVARPELRQGWSREAVITTGETFFFRGFACRLGREEGRTESRKKGREPLKIEIGNDEGI